MRAQAQRRWRMSSPLDRGGDHDMRAPLRDAARVVVAVRRHVVASRRVLPRLGTVGVALAIPVGLLSEQWWVLGPAAAFAWWFAPRAWGWEWLSAVLMGIVGTGWAAVGAFSLGTWPDDRALIGALWIGAAASMSCTAALLRRAARS
jgi:hypothetical protein